MGNTSSNTKLAALVPIACRSCDGLARLVGLEAVGDGEDTADLCTYECNACGDVQTRVFLKTSAERLTEALEQEGLTNSNPAANSQTGEDDLTVPRATPSDDDRGADA